MNEQDSMIETVMTNIKANKDLTPYDTNRALAFIGFSLGKKYLIHASQEYHRQVKMVCDPAKMKKITKKYREEWTADNTEFVRSLNPAILVGVDLPRKLDPVVDSWDHPVGMSERDKKIYRLGELHLEIARVEKGLLAV